MGEKEELEAQALLAKHSVEIIKDRLYFCAVTGRVPPAHPKRLLFSTDTDLHYEPFHRDFGPLNMAMLYRYCTRLSMLLSSKQHKDKAIYHWTSAMAGAAAARTNAAYLIAAYSLIVLGKSPADAYAPLVAIEKTLAGFRDASYSATCEYKLLVKDCIHGLSQGMLHGWLDFSTFKLHEYEFYERVENGDLNVVLPGKFVSFAGPHNEHKWDNGYPLLAPEDYFEIFRRTNVTDIVRLNNVLYDRSRFVDAGFVHHDLFFVDGSIPPEPILEQFLRIAETARGAIAVHCKAGLGRTGTLISCYMMKHYMLTAAECIAWLRVSRPGSVLGPQQFYLQDKQMEMWAAGAKLGVKRKEFGVSDEDLATAGMSDISLTAHASAEHRVYAAPETTAPAGVEQGDYLNANKMRRQNAAAAHNVNSARPNNSAAPSRVGKV
eukprot:m.139064 g.139064  ORF g.139064 m.139064 type:complete len:434 (-) comp17610_c0_seq1:168-1469(-)